MPNRQVINGFKGTLDFYVYMGLNCVRSWPRSPGRDRAPSVQKGWPAFTWAAKNWNSIQPEIQEAYNRMAHGTNMTGRDLFVKCYLSTMLIHLD